MNRLKIYFTFIIIFFFSFEVLATPDSSSHHTYVANISYPDHTVKVSICMGCKVAPDRNKTYHWMSYNNIKTTQGGYDGKLLHGVYSSTYLTEQLKEKGYFYYGLKHGEWVGWFTSGKIRSVEQWKEGLRDGAFIEYDPKGIKLAEYHYKKDRLHGKSIVLVDKIYVEKKYRNGVEIVKRTKNKEQRQKTKDLQRPIIPDTLKKVDTVAVNAQPVTERKTVTKKNPPTVKADPVKKTSEKAVTKNPSEKKKVNTDKEKASQTADTKEKKEKKKSSKINWQFWKKSEIRNPKSEVR